MKSTQRVSDNSSCLITDSTMDSLGFGMSLLTLVLVLFNLNVIAGNVAVIAAVLTTEKLRTTVTNTFVLSLAVADLLLGVTVLPLSITKQVLDQWPFGETWCIMWMTVDSWLCTASILNLCAISLDRYLAIGWSFRYPRLMSPFRAKVLVSAVWILAVLICFPPLTWWWWPTIDFSNGFLEMEELKYLRNQVYPSNKSLTHNLSIENTVVPSHPPTTMRNCSTNDISIELSSPQCRLYLDPWYVVYSALGSFWIPMLVMVTFYWRIYVTAKRATTAIRRGVIVQSAGKHRKTSPQTDMPGNNDFIALRVHRGGGGGAKNCSPTAGKQCQKLCQSQPGNSSLLCGDNCRKTEAAQNSRHCQMRGADHDAFQADQRRRTPCTSLEDTQSGQWSQTIDPSPSKAAMETTSRTCMSSTNSQTQQEQLNFKGPGEQLNCKGKTAVFKGKDRDLLSNNLMTNLRRLNKEKKAAKTIIGVIVGCFVACWMPFFTIYLLVPFCPGCTREEVSTVFFWLGYFNSALNPFIYGLCSKDFRSAFYRLLRINRYCPTAARRS